MLSKNTPPSSRHADFKYGALILLGLAAVIISSLDFAFTLSQDREEVTDVDKKLVEQITPLMKEVPAAGDDSRDEPLAEEPEFANLLKKKSNYQFPFGAAEVEAYYTQVESATTLDGSGPTVTCSALVIVDGPELLMKALTAVRFGTPPTVVIGSENSGWSGINESTKDNPVKLLVTLGSTFEGEAVGCMSVVFDTFTLAD